MNLSIIRPNAYVLIVDKHFTEILDKGRIIDYISIPSNETGYHSTSLINHFYKAHIGFYKHKCIASFDLKSDKFKTITNCYKLSELLTLHADSISIDHDLFLNGFSNHNLINLSLLEKKIKLSDNFYNMISSDDDEIEKMAFTILKQEINKFFI